MTRKKSVLIRSIRVIRVPFRQTLTNTRLVFNLAKIEGFC